MILTAQLAFYLAALAGASYFTIRCRRVDFFTVGFASSVLYFMPGFFGFVRSSRDFSAPQQIVPETYAIFIAVMLSILIGAVLFDFIVKEPVHRSEREIPADLTTEVALAIALLALAATLATAGQALFAAEKATVMENIGRWHILYRFAGIFVLVFAIIRRQPVLLAVGALVMLFDLFVGFRSGIVIGILAAGTLFLNRLGPQSLIKTQRKSLIFGLLAAVVFIAYKQIYVVVKLGLWDAVVAKIFDGDTLRFALVNSEPFTTQAILNEVVRTEFYTGPDHLGSLSNLLVPFAPMLGAESVSYNDLFQEPLFGGVVVGGMANNIWAEMYSVGGWLALAIGIPIFAALLWSGSRFLMTSRASTLALVAVVFTYIAFYIHRNDIGFTLTLVRRAFFVWIVLVLPAMLITDFRRIQSSRRMTGTRLSES